MSEIRGYMRDDTRCLLGGVLGGPRRGGGQLESVDEDRPYIYEWPEESKDCTRLSIEILDICACPVIVKEDVVGISRPKKKEDIRGLELLRGRIRRKNINDRFIELAFTGLGISRSIAFHRVTVLMSPSSTRSCTSWSSAVVRSSGLR